MKTIFDWLCCADFRTKPEMFIGHGNLNTLETWINGYADGCFDAGHPECYYYTPNGIPYFLLRDYIALQENDQSVGGIAFILLQSAGGNEEKAWNQFFVYLDAFMELTIIESVFIDLTDSMRQHYDETNERYQYNPNGTPTRCHYNVRRLKRVILSNGMCWVEEYPAPSKGTIAFFDPRSIDCQYRILPEKEMDEELRRLFGTDLEWKRIVTSANEDAVRFFINVLAGKRLERLCCEAEILDFLFEGNLVLHAMGMSRIIFHDDILVSTIDYQSWDGEVSTNNDEWINVEQYREKIIGGTVVSVFFNRVHDLRIELDNGIVIECLVANGYPHHEEEFEQWVLFEHTADHSGRFLTVYNKTIEFRNAI